MADKLSGDGIKLLRLIDRIGLRHPDSKKNEDVTASIASIFYGVVPLSFSIAQTFDDK